jgi:hypothetical protein
MFCIVIVAHVHVLYCDSRTREKSQKVKKTEKRRFIYLPHFFKHAVRFVQLPREAFHFLAVNGASVTSFLRFGNVSMNLQFEIH